MQSNNQYESVFPTVPEVGSDNHENIVLVYGSSQKDTYSAIGFQVARSLRRIERVGDVVTLDDGETTSFGRIGENGYSQSVNDPGQDIFRIDSGREETIIEYGIGVPQDGVWVAVESASGDLISGLREGDDRERGYGSSDLEDRAAVLSDYTTVSTPEPSVDDAVPTTALAPRRDQGLVRVDSREDGLNEYRFAFRNDSGEEVDVDLTAWGMAYHVRPVTEESTVESMLTGEIDSRLLTWGGFGNQNPNMPGDWYDYNIDISSGDLMPEA